MTPRRTKLSIRQILQWADTYYEEYGCWPMVKSKRTIKHIRQGLDEKWSNIDNCLREGLRGLRPGNSLARLLAEHRGRRNPKALPNHTIRQILTWADAYHHAHGKWPTVTSGPISGTNGENWATVNATLTQGGRGLPGGSSLARLLAQHRGRRNRKALPKYTIRQILAWADAYHHAHGRWPTVKSGPISGTRGETWGAVGAALLQGSRGLPGGHTLPRLLAAKRGVKNIHDLPQLSARQILAWADAYHQRMGMWPKVLSGHVKPADMTWHAIDLALRRGTHGLQAGQSLARLLSAKRGMPRQHRRQPPYSIKEILRWADAYHDRTGKWPSSESGPIREAPGESWYRVHRALRFGKRGMPAGMSLGQLLAEQRGIRNPRDLPKFTIPLILRWADAHHARYRKWPNRSSGPISGVPGETWSAVASALSAGLRGLPGGTTLAQLLSNRRGVSNRLQKPRFLVSEILAWADAYQDRTGRWPAILSGPVMPDSKTTWAHVDNALRVGCRGLPGGTSLFQLLIARRRIVRPRR